MKKNNKQRLIKKIAILMIMSASVFSMCFLCSCGSKENPASVEEIQPEKAEENGPEAASDTEKIRIVTTVFPLYDWILNIAGEQAENDSVEVILLYDNGLDPHSYQPTADDIITISTCDVMMYVGGESDKWIDEALDRAVNKDMKVMRMIDSLGDLAREEEHSEGMQEEDHEHAEEDDGKELDEHIWLSLKNAQVLCEEAARILADADPAHAESYQEQARDYADSLKELDGEYENTVSTSAVHTLVFGDRFPFLYLTEDYDIEYYAAFAGCSAETEASFETIIFLAGKVDELSLGYVMTIDGSDQKIAKTIIENTVSGDQQILMLDSMQSVTAEEMQEGISYLDVMQTNLETLQTALN